MFETQVIFRNKQTGKMITVDFEKNPESDDEYSVRLSNFQKDEISIDNEEHIELLAVFLDSIGCLPE
jgi:hypothetical protein